MKDDILKFFAKYIEDNLGIVYHEASFFQLEHRLDLIAKQLGIPDITELYNKSKITIDGPLKSLLLDVATNNETSFFRDQSVFAALSSYVLPELCSDSSNLNIDIWSAASSSGQEAYSIAMEYDSYKTANPSTPPLRLLASDVSKTILKRAEEGIYSQLEVQRGLPARMMLKYFDKDAEDKWHVKPYLKRGFEFKHINLLETFPPIGPFNVIFCRNVLIYQSIENKKKVLSKLYQHLKPRGFLFLGAAESLLGLTDDFTQVPINGAIAFQKK